MALPPCPTLEPFGELQLGDHLCLPVDSDTQRLAGTAWFTDLALRNGGKVLVLTETETPDEMTALLHTRVAGAGAALASGQLNVLACQELYFPDLVFDPDRMMAGYADRINEAQRQGYPGLWAAIDMAWSLLDLPGTDLLLDYEAAANPAFGAGGVAAGCIYDRSRFSADVIEGACSAHPLTPGQAPLRFSDTTDPPGLALYGELDLTNRAALTALLRSLYALPGHITIDATGLQFIDLRSADLLFEAYVARGPGNTTIAGSPLLSRLLELVAHSRPVGTGWPGF